MLNSVNFDIVFLGGLFPKEIESEISNNSIGPIDNAANNLQWSLITGLDALLKHPVTIINSLYIGPYPKRYKKLIIRDYAFSHTTNSRDINVGFINLTGVKHISRMLSVQPYLKKWASIETGRPKVIIAYALTNIFLESLCFIKHAFPDIVTIIVVPDLPQYMNTTNKSSYAYKIFKTISIKHILMRKHAIDGYALLTKHMADALNINNKNYVVVEGISNNSPSIKLNDITPDEIVRIVYTGTLNIKYGVVNLVKAFMKTTNNSYRLILCGAGDSEQFILDSAKVDNRIIYKGQLQRDEIIDIQNNATVLVNPRQNFEEFTKYSFPSKIMEYLSSGRPVIAYKLDGMPDEYDEYIFYVPSNDIDALTHKLIEICSKPNEYLNSFGAAARTWVQNNKNAAVQANKIIHMISEMLEQ